MSWHAYYEGDDVIFGVNGKLHCLDAESALKLSESMRRMAEHSLRQKARRASEVAQTKVKEENARHQ